MNSQQTHDNSSLSGLLPPVEATTCVPTRKYTLLLTPCRFPQCIVDARVLCAAFPPKAKVWDAQPLRPVEADRVRSATSFPRKNCLQDRRSGRSSGFRIKLPPHLPMLLGVTRLVSHSDPEAQWIL